MVKIKVRRLKGLIPENSFVMVKNRKPQSDSEPFRLADHLSMAGVESAVAGCTRCTLCHSRKQLVFGEGPASPQLVFIGEAPGSKEDEVGRPFVGNAGVLLNKMIDAMKLKREQLYLLNLVKCMPPGHRSPSSEEISACHPVLQAQLRVLKPKVLVTLGVRAAQTLLKSDEPLLKLRGKVHSLKINQVETKLIATYHPAFLLKNPELKKDCWEDLKSAIKILG